MSRIVTVFTSDQVDSAKKLTYNRPRPLKIIETESKMRRSAQYKNLIDVFNQADESTIEEGKVWYKTAHLFAQELANSFDITLEQAASVISCLSPASKWERNLIDAENLIKSFYHRGYIGAQAVTCCTYGRQKIKAIEVLTGRLTLTPKQGLKTYNFANNIRDPDDARFVTIDRHAYRLVHNKVTKGGEQFTDKEYAYLAVLYKLAAKDLGYTPCQIQAITWVQYSRKG